MNPPRPNLLWILTTQWRAQACGYAGDPNARTPRLDRLAAESVDYSQAVTPHPFGPFARAALLTGVPCPANGVRDYFDPLPSSARTIAHALDARGYATAFFGKWHLAPRDPRAPLVGEAHARMIVPPGSRGGFALWEGFESGFQLNDPWLHGTRLPQARQFPGYQSDVLCARASEWLADRGRAGGAAGAPWFCVVSLEPPHPPYDAASGRVRPRDGSGLVLRGNVPAGGVAEARARRELAGYYAHLEATDAAIGGLIDAVAGRDTVVVFTSVHGDMHGAHGLFRKGWPHEESVRVPLLVRDGRDGRGRRESAPISLLELPARTLAWADGAAPPSFRDAVALSMPSVVALPDQCDRLWRGVRTRSHKLILNGDGSPWLLFDLDRDPLELENRAASPESAALIAALQARHP